MTDVLETTLDDMTNLLLSPVNNLECMVLVFAMFCSNRDRSVTFFTLQKLMSHSYNLLHFLYNLMCQPRYFFVKNDLKNPTYKNTAHI